MSDAGSRPHPTEDQFRILVESVRDYAIFLLNPQGEVVSWNLGAERIKGYSTEEILGRHFSCFYPPEAIAEGRPGGLLRTALRTGSAEDEGWRLRKDGTRFWADVVISAMRDASGRHTGFADVTRDLTDRRMGAEARLRESEERFARFAQHLPGLAWIKDRDGRYIYVNQAATLAFGVPREAMTGRTDAEIFPPETAALFRANDQRAIESPSGIEVVERLVDGHGTLRHSIVSKFPIFDAEGHPHLVGGIAIDITERVRAEEALRDADRRKDEFLATLSHELRNPLAPMRNAVHLVRSGAGGWGGEGRGHELFEMLEHQLDHMIRLVDDLLEVARITSGKIELRREPFDLGEVISRAVQQTQSQLDTSSVRLSVSLPNEPLVVEADPVRLSQVISNLLNNGAKYTPAGGHVWVTAFPEGHQAVITVRDDGVGIPADMLSKVFEMFAQVNQTLGRAQGGLGIGLALSKTLIELHGGHIEARSEGPDKGSEFVVRVPLSERRRAPRRPSAEPGVKPDTVERVLVVDDSRDGADSLGMVLKMLGAEATVVYDGASALDAMRDKPPGVVLLDIGMPGMDGYQVAAQIRADPRYDEVRLIALTGWGTEEERRRSREAGFNDHWVKPVDPAKLKTLLAGA